MWLERTTDVIDRYRSNYGEWLLLHGHVTCLNPYLRNLYIAELGRLTWLESAEIE